MMIGYIELLFFSLLLYNAKCLFDHLYMCVPRLSSNHTFIIFHSCVANSVKSYDLNLQLSSCALGNLLIICDSRVVNYERKRI